jgi:hypothetical protein
MRPLPIIAGALIALAGIASVVIEIDPRVTFGIASVIFLIAAASVQAYLDRHKLQQAIDTIQEESRK